MILSYSIGWSQLEWLKFPREILQEQEILSVKVYSECPGCKPTIPAWLTDSFIIADNGDILYWHRISKDGSLQSIREYYYEDDALSEIKFKVNSNPASIEYWDSSIVNYVKQFRYNEYGQIVKLLSQGPTIRTCSLTEFVYENGRVVQELKLIYRGLDYTSKFESERAFLNNGNATRIRNYSYKNDTTFSTLIVDKEVTKYFVEVEDCELNLLKEYEYDKDSLLLRTNCTKKDDFARPVKMEGFINSPFFTGEYSNDYFYDENGLLIRKEKFVDNELLRVLSYEYVK